MLVKDLLEELRDIDPESDFEIAVAVPGFDAEVIHTEMMFMLQHGTFTIFVS